MLIRLMLFRPQKGTISKQCCGAGAADFRVAPEPILGSAGAASFRRIRLHLLGKQN